MARRGGIAPHRALRNVYRPAGAGACNLPCSARHGVRISQTAFGNRQRTARPQPKLNPFTTHWDRSRKAWLVQPCLATKVVSMDDLLREFLTETNESLDVVDVELVRFEQDPNNAKILDNIFRLVHTIKGTCGFLGLPRLEALAHAAETLMGKFRDGTSVTNEAVSLVLSTIDRIKEILASLEADQAEPEGDDQDLIAKLEKMSLAAEKAPAAKRERKAATVGHLVPQTLERPLRVGEVSLDELEKAFRETEVEAFMVAVKPAAPAKKPSAPEKKRAAAEPPPRSKDAREREEDKLEGGVAAQSIRVNVDTLETLM